MNKIFISHSKEQKETFVKPLLFELKSLNMETWFDKFNIFMGEDIFQTIHNGIMQSKYFVVVISKDFLSKEWPKEELKTALNIYHHKSTNSEIRKIFPIYYDINTNDVEKFFPELKDIAYERFDNQKPIARYAERIVSSIIYDQLQHFKANTLEKITENYKKDTFLHSLLKDIQYLKNHLEKYLNIKITLKYLKTFHLRDPVIDYYFNIVEQLFQYTKNQNSITDDQMLIIENSLVLILNLIKTKVN